MSPLLLFGASRPGWEGPPPCDVAWPLRFFKALDDRRRKHRFIHRSAEFRTDHRVEPPLHCGHTLRTGGAEFSDFHFHRVIERGDFLDSCRGINRAHCAELLLRESILVRKLASERDGRIVFEKLKFDAL